MRIAKITLTILFLLSLLMPAQVAHADIAPPAQPFGSNVVPGEVTMVQMTYERVVIDLRAPWSDGNDADVTAKFVMRNQGTVDEQMTVGFPLNNITTIPNQGGIRPQLKKLVVKINDSVIDYESTSNFDWLINQEQDAVAHNFAIFKVTFPVQQDVIIEVNYKQPPTYDAPTTQYDYVLFSGAGWYKTILEGDILFRLPYTVAYGENYWTDDDDNVWGGVDSETIVENEVRWHFEDFEPQNYYSDNWKVDVIRPKDWERVLSAREALVNNQYNAELWMELGDAYENTAGKLGGKTCDSSLDAITAYQQSANLKPDWAEAHARLAREYYKAYCDWEFQAFAGTQSYEELRQGALQELSVALAFDPNNKTALDLKSELEMGQQPLELPPPTPYATPNAYAGATLSQTESPNIVTVVHTKIVEAPTLIPAPSSAVVSSPTQTMKPVEEKPNSMNFIFGGLVIFVAGIGAGVYFSKRK